MLEKRQEKILNAIIKEYGKTGIPVGSSGLVEKYRLDVSPATVRNEMADLEELGYIRQPYTSAGRIPTEKSYKYYVGRVEEKKLKPEESDLIKALLHDKTEFGLKQVAKIVSKISGNAVFWAFHRRNLYYTGITNLLSQPEFVQNNLVYDISIIIDRMDEIIEKHFEHFDFVPQIFVGSENPFSRHCSVIATKYRHDGHIGLIGVIGPMRMRYEKNLALIKFIYEKFK